MAKIETLTVIVVEKNDRKYVLHCDPQSPLGELHDALVEMKDKIIETMAALDKKKSEEPIVEDFVPDICKAEPK